MAYADVWNNFPDFKVGDGMFITWNEDMLGIQEYGRVILDTKLSNSLHVVFDNPRKVIPLDAVRAQEKLERVEKIKITKKNEEKFPIYDQS